MSPRGGTTKAAPDPARVATALLARAGSDLQLVSCRKIQTLWAGYGFICAVKAVRKTSSAAGAEVPLILKLISPPPSQTATENDEGHLRKMLSYEVERYFYSSIAPRLRTERGVAVAECLVTTATPMTTAEARETSATTTTPSNQEGEEGKSDPVLDGVLAILMTDLRVEFPVSGEKRSELSERQVHAALDWLARFHGSTWDWSRSADVNSLDELVLPPLEEAAQSRQRRQQSTRANPIGESKVWLNGGYTYLATRRKEFSSLLDQVDTREEDEWAAALCHPLNPPGSQPPPRTGTTASSPCVAEMVARVLTPRGDRACETLIHGDVKSENLFTSADHARVAFFDFQYVGLGLGACDLAKLFTCSVPLSLLLGVADAKRARKKIGVELGMEKGEEALLRRYHAALLAGQTTDGAEGSRREYDWELFVRHWETALVDWHRFQISWGQWGNVDWLEARVRAILKDQGWRAWLQKAYDEYPIGSARS